MHWMSSVRGLESLVASSAKFRTLTGAANAEAAKAFIHIGGVPEDESKTMPWALVFPETFDEQVCYSQSGALTLSIEIPQTAYVSQTTRETKYVAFLTDLDTILDEMRTNSRNRSVLWNMKSVVSSVSPYLAEDGEAEADAPFYTASFLIGWV